MNQKNLLNRKENGITLIALVITIIVLLILAGVAISMLSGENGILRQAASAKMNTENASEKEQVQLAALAALTAGHGNVDDNRYYEVLNTELNKINGYEGTIQKGDLPKTITIRNNSYTIEEGGTVSIPKTPAKVTIASLIESGKPVDTKTTIAEDDGDLVTIPEKFKIAPDSGETVEEGIVVIAPDGSEFVWVPVPDVIYDGKTQIKVGKQDTEGVYTPMARTQSGTTKYQGIFYNLYLAEGSQAVADMNVCAVGTTNAREPSLVTGNDADTYADMNNVTGTLKDSAYYDAAGFSSVQEFGKDMQNEYDNMVKSVDKYKGFYVGRFETGIENNKAVSKNASTNTTVTTANASQSATRMWYGLYNKQRTMATDHSYKGVESSMIWGSQYDAMMNWMIKTGHIVGSGFLTSKWSSGVKVTGQSTKDIMNNVHDLYGCHTEWTLEATLTTHRNGRSGRYDDRIAPSSRIARDAGEVHEYSGSRLTLYIENN